MDHRPVFTYKSHGVNEKPQKLEKKSVGQRWGHQGVSASVVLSGSSNGTGAWGTSSKESQGEADDT